MNFVTCRPENALYQYAYCNGSIPFRSNTAVIFVCDYISSEMGRLAQTSHRSNNNKHRTWKNEKLYETVRNHSNDSLFLPIDHIRLWFMIDTFCVSKMICLYLWKYKCIDVKKVQNTQCDCIDWHRTPSTHKFLSIITF